VFFSLVSSERAAMEKLLVTLLASKRFRAAFGVFLELNNARKDLEKYVVPMTLLKFK